MGRISVPVEDLNDTVNALKDIGERITGTARLSDVGSEDEVGDSTLAASLSTFDETWGRGHEKVKENVDVFSENAQAVADNFTKTDDDSANALEDSGE